VTSSHWSRWHEPYDDPNSYLSARLGEVQRQLVRAIDQRPEATITLTSICAGQGRDVLEVLAAHPRGRDVRARLVELDPANVAVAERYRREHSLANVEIVVGDAGASDAYLGVVPSQLVLACGVFGNLSAADIEGTIAWLPALCDRAAHVIWTRHRREPDRTPWIRGLFADAGFREVVLAAPREWMFVVGTHQLDREPPAFEPGRRVFCFVGEGERPA